MGYRTLPYTFQRNGNYYLQIRLSNGRMYKKSLLTDSYREASALMIGVTPHIPFVKSLATPISVFDSFLSNLIASERKAARNPLFLHQQIAPPVEIVESQPPAEPEKVLTLLDAWAMYKDEKGRNWTKSISMANERFIEVLMIVLGAATDVTTITKQDIKQVMEVVENLPKRVVQPYRSMTTQQLIDFEDVPPEDLVGAESIHKHLKIYKSLFKTFLTDNKDILEKSQIKFDEDSQRYYFLIAEGGQGKTENATRQVVIHPKLIEWGFMDYVDRQWKERIFSEVAGTNMTKIGKVLADVRDQLAIPYLDDYGQRRLVHSFRHTMISTCLAGWVGNLAHLQQVVGHEKSGSGITQRYLHTFPLSSVSYVIDGLCWES